MSRVTLTVNGDVGDRRGGSRARILPTFCARTRLLTGTHLGCEHGVCGACTLLIDGAPARSCIAFAVACDGADVRTIEGLEDDPVIVRLRAAFTAEHALQCGYCTPGMLVTARDIVQRLPDADEARIRLELAGNLCRCTGYAGIVRAIRRVLAEGVPAGVAAPAPLPALPVMPTPSPASAIDTSGRHGSHSDAAYRVAAADGVGCHPRSDAGRRLRAGRAAGCRGGRSVARRGACLARSDRDAVQRRRHAWLRRCRSARGNRLATAATPAPARGSARAPCCACRSWTAMRPRCDCDRSTTRCAGRLAQFARGAVVREFAAEIAEITARNLEARLRGETTDAPRRLSIGGLTLRVIWRRLRAVLDLR